MRFLFLLFLGSVMSLMSMGQTGHMRDYEPPATKETEFYKQQITDEVTKQLAKIDWSQTYRTTSSSAVLYTIPVVVHVLHNYGPELTSTPDTAIYNMIRNLNSYFLKTTPDTINIIDKFKPIASSTQIKFKLATLDTNGNPTKGIDHIFSYLTNSNYEDQAKIGQWPQDRYLNIWVTNAIFEGAGYTEGAYATTPFIAAYTPYYDGIMVIPAYDTNGNVMSFYAGRYLNLRNTCGFETCADYDLIADTPPCSEGSVLDVCANLYDTSCHDTSNVQNIMTGGAACGIMFTYGQAQYMQYILQINTGNRNNLVTPANYTATGMGLPMPDLKPVPDFSISNTPGGVQTPPNHFFYQGQTAYFTNHSWGDTVTGVQWTFSNNASVVSSTSATSVANHFHQPGWVAVSLTATGNNTGPATLTNHHALYVTDSIATSATGYVQEFDERGGLSEWPIFNYYNNNFQWQMGGVGCYDHSSLEYAGYDARPFPQNMTGTPYGDVDDIFTPAFDLTSYGSNCYLNFMSSGATRAVKTKFMTDALEIDYSANKGPWVKMTSFTGAQLANKGTVAEAYVPMSSGDWVERYITLPASAVSTYTTFRFRYTPGSDSLGMSTGNNFYLDHFNFSGFPESVSVAEHMANGISLLPNPSTGNTTLVIKDNADIPVILILVTDITGKAVYTTTLNNNNSITRVALPASAFPAKGMYLVHVVTDKIDQTQKLVIY